MIIPKLSEYLNKIEQLTVTTDGDSVDELIFWWVKTGITPSFPPKEKMLNCGDCVFYLHNVNVNQVLEFIKFVKIENYVLKSVVDSNGVDYKKPILNEKQNIAEPDWDIWAKWYTLVNMTDSELKSFMDSKEGADAGLTKKEAEEEGGINTGWDSAKMLLKMIPKGQSWKSAKENWTQNMWYWARRQNSFISRMRGNDGPLYDENKEKTRKHTSLLIWGHNPKKKLKEKPTKPKDL